MHGPLSRGRFPLRGLGRDQMSQVWWRSWRPTTPDTSPGRSLSWTADWSCDAPLRGIYSSLPTTNLQTKHYHRRSLRMADLSEKVKDIIEKELGVEREKLTNEASFIEDLGADSLDIVELVMEFEKEFNIDIPDEDAERLRTVGDALAYLNEKVKA